MSVETTNVILAVIFNLMRFWVGKWSERGKESKVQTISK